MGGGVGGEVKGDSSNHTAWRHSIKEITWIPTSNSMPTAGAAHSPIWLVCIHYTCTGTGHYHHSQDTSPPSPSSTPLLLVDRLGIECVYTYMYNVDNKYIYNQRDLITSWSQKVPLSICKGLSPPRGTGQGTCSPSLLIKLKRGCVEMFGLFMQKEVV